MILKCPFHPNCPMSLRFRAARKAPGTPQIDLGCRFMGGLLNPWKCSFYNQSIITQKIATEFHFNGTYAPPQIFATPYLCLVFVLSTFFFFCMLLKAKFICTQRKLSKQLNIFTLKSHMQESCMQKLVIVTWKQMTDHKSQNNKYSLKELYHWNMFT